MQKRLLNLTLFLVTLVIEVLIALFIRDRFIRPYIGDVLVVAVVYFFLRIFVPEKYPWLPAVVFVFAATVEFSQYLGLADRLGVTNPVLKTILGSVYDTMDIVCYGVGCAFLDAYEWVRRKRDI